MHESDPISNVEWVDAQLLHANDWNPNFVYSPELTLLEYSILRNGWIQPLLVSDSGDGRMMVIDGFHRWTLALNSDRIKVKYKGEVPVVVLAIPVHEAMLLTVRINRAKGEHQAKRMHRLIRRLIDEHGCDRQEVATGIGATLDEVEKLYQADIWLERNLKNWAYSYAWDPIDPPTGYTRGAQLEQIRAEHGPGGEFVPTHEESVAKAKRAKRVRNKPSKIKRKRSTKL